MAIGKCYVFPDTTYDTKFVGNVKRLESIRKTDEDGNIELPLIYRYYPPYCSGVSDVYYEFEEAKDILELDFVKWFMTSKDRERTFKHFTLCKATYHDYLNLYAIYDEDTNYGPIVAKIYNAENIDWSPVKEIHIIQQEKY